jgi:hydrogenase expression/formation protein HypC
MCLAIPMRVTEIRDDDYTSTAQVAVVDVGGIQKEVRLDIVDRRPAVGDYVIVHAGFAIHALDRTEAEANLRLLMEAAEGIR